MSKNNRQPPQKPYKEFPLFAHLSGQWCKKIKGKLRYFGVWADHEAALKRYLDEVDDLHAGRDPSRDGKPTVADACNAYLESSLIDVEAGKIRQATLDERLATCKMMTTQLGRTIALDDLIPANFDKLRLHLAKTCGPTRFTNEVHRVRSVLKYAFESGLVDRPVLVGPKFKGASKAERRKEKNARPSRMFTAEQCCRLIDNARQPLKTFILLGLNCGFGNKDIADLPCSAVDLDKGWINYPRPKTHVPRKCPLWPATIQALRECMEKRKLPVDPAHIDLVFLTNQRRPWRNMENGTDSIGLAFGKLLRQLDMKQDGVNFYALRHCFQTIGESGGDQLAVKQIMGHVDESISATYREAVHEPRLRAVALLVRKWLLCARVRLGCTHAKKSNQ